MSEFLKSKDVRDKVLDIHHNGRNPGSHVGFNSLRDLYRVKLGCTTYYTGSPTSGKSELMFEVLINLSEFYGWKHVIHTPETGKPEDIILELAHKYLSKPYSEISTEELYTAMGWIDEYFTILDNKDVQGLDLEQFMKLIETHMLNYEVHTVTIDPWNELEHNMGGLREDEYLKQWLSRIRRFARLKHIHFNIVAHPRTPQKNKDGQYLPATAYDMSGGSQWYNKAESILALHRPAEMDTGEPNKNMVKVMVQKAKPKEVGNKGTCELFFDWTRNRYYEVDSTGMHHYARKELGKYHNPNTGQMQEVKPNEDFDNVPF